MMMNGAMVTLVGVAVSQVRYSTTVGGVPVAQFRLAATERRFDRPRQVWVEGNTSFFNVWAWRSLAENALTSIGCGDPVLVTGRMRIREWDRTDGRPKGVSAEIEATALGHDLARGTTVFRRTVRGRPELVAPARASMRPVNDSGTADRTGAAERRAPERQGPDRFTSVDHASKETANMDPASTDAARNGVTTRDASGEAPLTPSAAGTATQAAPTAQTRPTATDSAQPERRPAALERRSDGPVTPVLTLAALDKRQGRPLSPAPTSPKHRMLGPASPSSSATAPAPVPASVPTPAPAPAAAGTDRS